MKPHLRFQKLWYNDLKMPKQVPFSIDRDDTRSLIRQIEDGIRGAILDGFYKPGETLPSSRELAPMLGVSRIVTQAALRRLANDGVIVSRPRCGSVVRDTAAKQWRGHVVFVYPAKDVSYFQTILAETLRTGLNAAGYLFTRASVDSVSDSGDGPFDFSLLDAALARSVDLVVLLYNRMSIFRHLASRGIPYAAIAQTAETPPGAVGLVRLDYDAAVPDFATSCQSRGIRKVVQLAWDSMMCDAVPGLLAAGIDASSISLRSQTRHGDLFSVENAGFRRFTRIIASRKRNDATAYFFADDYIARGAITAMLAAGLTSPSDMRFASWANTGLGPAFIREISRMEMSPSSAGAIATEAVLEYLAKGRFPQGRAIVPRWRDGETL